VNLSDADLDALIKDWDRHPDGKEADAYRDLQEARAAIKAYVDWCDNKAGPNVIPYEVLDNLRKCVEHE
jgi:hypothetical protein